MPYLEGMDILSGEETDGATGTLKVEIPSPNEEKKESKEENELEPKEVVEEEEGEEQLELEPKEGEEEPQLSYRPSLKEINKEFPDLFKKFPDLRSMYFREAKYADVFPTLEEAQTAKEELEGFVALRENLSSGKVEDVVSVVGAIAELGDNSLSNFAINIIPALKKKSEEAYAAAIAPELVNWVRNLYDQGIRNQNDNMKNAALVASLHYFGDQEVATGKKGIKLPAPQVSSDEKSSEIDKERKAFLSERYVTLSQDVSSDYEEEIKDFILDGLDSDEVMTPYMRNVLTKDVVTRIDKVLASDRGHQGQMQLLWKKAQKGNFGREWKDKILTAALSRAKSVMPTIRARAKAEALSTKQLAGDKMLNSTRNSKKEALNTSTTRSENKSSVQNLDLKKIDWKKTSDLDIIQGNVTLKS